MDESYLSILPPELADGIRRLPTNEQHRLQELRLRCGYPASYLAGAGERTVPCGMSGFRVNSSCLQGLLNRATGYCTYAAASQLRYGFLTLPGGHRLGLCGQAVVGPHGELKSLKHLTSANLRIARQVAGCGQDAIARLKANPASTLIAGPPGCGKTTLLRELIRHRSDVCGERVGIVDERMELAACSDGIPGFRVGSRTDVLSGVTKHDGVYMLLRTMNPDWIAVDEITDERDVDALLRSSFCGVRILASAHVFTRDDLYSRPLYARMCRLGLFENLILMDKKHRIRFERMDANDKTYGCGIDHCLGSFRGDPDGTQRSDGGSESSADSAGHGTHALRNSKLPYPHKGTV